MEKDKFKFILNTRPWHSIDDVGNYLNNLLSFNLQLNNHKYLLL